MSSRNTSSPFIALFPPHQDLAYAAINVIPGLTVMVRQLMQQEFAASIAVIWGVIGAGKRVGIDVRMAWMSMSLLCNEDEHLVEHTFAQHFLHVVEEFHLNREAKPSLLSRLYGL
ncbi:hypothetical protein K439DRAFT_1540730 [Ramaria rubella]|nr:hypothetical protein K439DRAFT_1540730 [Ramaria rubella]